MKRKTTSFQQSLLNNGFKLYAKIYYGKYSEKVLAYIFTKQVEYKDFKFNLFVKIGKKDDLVQDYGIYDLPFAILGVEQLEMINSIVREHCSLIKDLEYATKYVGSRANDYLTNEDDDEVVEVAEVIETNE